MIVHLGVKKNKQQQLFACLQQLAHSSRFLYRQMPCSASISCSDLVISASLRVEPSHLNPSGDFDCESVANTVFSVRGSRLSPFLQSDDKMLFSASRSPHLAIYCPNSPSVITVMTLVSICNQTGKRQKRFKQSWCSRAYDAYFLCLNILFTLSSSRALITLSGIFRPLRKDSKSSSTIFWELRNC